MANPTINGGTPFTGKLRVAGIQTVVPTKPTDPRKSSRIVVVSQNPTAAAAAVMRRRFNVLLCYNKASSEDSGWLVAGRIRESLARALQEQPLLAGRLRRSEKELEIVSNDSGGRLVEAAAEMELVELVGMKEKKREGEAELVFWEDVLHHTPQFSPLFYVQVTNFTCGGYSIGISCSLLLSDPFALTNTIKKWANNHNIFSRIEIPKMPTFYLPNHGKPPSSPSLLMGPNTNKGLAKSLIFNIPTNSISLDKNNIKNLAALCVGEAETSRQMPSNLTILMKTPLDDVRVEDCSKTGLFECSKPECRVDGMSCAGTWDELELEEICFVGGNKPIYASGWVNSVVDEGCVMIVPSTDSGVKIVVTFT